MKNLILLILTVTLFSCATPRQIARICNSCPAVVKDSVIVKETVRDTTIYITQKGPEVIVKSPCDSAGKLKPFKKVKKENGIKTTIESKGDTIVAICEVDSLKAVIEGLNKTIFHLKKETKIITRLCEYKHRNKFDGFTFYWFWITAAMVALYAGFRYFKTKF